MPVNGSVIDANTVVCIELMYRQITRVFYLKISRYKIELILPKNWVKLFAFPCKIGWAASMMHEDLKQIALLFGILVQGIQ